MMTIIDEFLKQHDPNAYARCERMRSSFVSDFTPEKISALSLEQYCHTGNQATFCYRLEYGLKDLSSMGDMHVDGYGVYIDSMHRIKIYRSLSKRFGTDYKSAFAFEKEEILKLLSAGVEEDYETIKDSVIQQQFRFKLLSVYYPDKFFPVCTMKAAKAYCDVFGIAVGKSDTMTDLNHNLVQWKENHLPEDWTLYSTMAFSDWLWRSHRKLDGSFSMRDDGVEKAKKIDSEIEELHLVGETRDAVIKQRVNQGAFRERLLSRYDHCALCQVDDRQLLVASHIKPWSESLPEEKLDYNNGFLMCPNHDKVFDRGLISFDDDGRIMISLELSKTNRVFLNVHEDMVIPLTEGNKKYLEYHRKHVYLN